MQTFRSKLLACFLLCMCIPTLLGAFVYQDLHSREKLETSLVDLEQGLSGMQQAVQQAHDFFTYGQRDVGFFANGESAELEEFRVTILQVRESLVRSESQIALQQRFGDKVDQFLNLSLMYESDVLALAKKLRARGFQGFGMVGEMRETAHQLEEKIRTPELKIHMLMLRRHEKDYIIRNQPEYVDKLIQQVDDFRRALASPRLAPDAKSDLLQLLNQYESQFKAIVAADAEIGIRGGAGEFSELVDAEKRLFGLLRAVRLDYTEQTLVVAKNLTNRLFVFIVLIGLVAIALGIFLSQSMTRPLRSLSAKIENFVETDFEAPIAANEIASHRDEIGQIARNFVSLQRTMRQHFISLRQQKDTLEEQSRRLETAQQMAKLGYWRWQPALAKFEVSDEVVEFIGDRPRRGDVPLAYFLSAVFKEDRARFESDLTTCLDFKEEVDGNYRICSADNRVFWIRQRLSVKQTENGETVVVAIVQDISDQKDAEEQIRHLAYFDSLTAVATRGYFNQKLEEMIRSASRRGEGFALFFIDLDKFKEINDSLGHDAGDALLKEVAHRLKFTARDSDFVARLGGDEFCVLLENLSAQGDIASVALRCLSNIMQPMMLCDKEITPMASLGIARFPEDGSDSVTIMNAADNAMYAAKNSGRHSYEFHDRQMFEEAAQRLALSHEIRRAVRLKEFVLHYQPQISMQTGKVEAWEALIRWQHPERGLLTPWHFIDEVERLSLMNELGEWVISEACRQIREWHNEGLKGLRVSVNIAPNHLKDQGLFQCVTEAVARNGVNPAQLEIEVTETGIQSAPEASATLEKLKSFGLKVAIDDFGTGYSSLGSLKYLPVDCLKVDRAFVKDVASNPEDEILLGTIMTLAQNFEFQIIAEGVEELEQIHILRGLGCDLLQGYFFSPPVPAHEVRELAARNFSEQMQGGDMGQLTA